MNIAKSVLLQIGYSDQHMKWTLMPRTPKLEKSERGLQRYCLSTIRKSNHQDTNSVEETQNRNNVHGPQMINNILPSAEAKINFESQNIYEITYWDCGQTYIGQTNGRINLRKAEHTNAVIREEATSLLIHVQTTSHIVDFERSKVVANIEHSTRTIREIIEIEKRTNNLNTWDACT